MRRNKGRLILVSRRSAHLLQLPELLIRAYVSPTLCHLAAVGAATVALRLTLGGWAGLPCSRAPCMAAAGGLPGNGNVLDAATIQRKLHTYAQYQLQALQVSSICFEF